MIQFARLCSILGLADEESIEHKHAAANALRHITRPLSDSNALEIIVDTFLIAELAQFW